MSSSNEHLPQERAPAALFTIFKKARQIQIQTNFSVCKVAKKWYKKKKDSIFLCIAGYIDEGTVDRLHCIDIFIEFGKNYWRYLGAAVIVGVSHQIDNT